jgi:predicted phosphodiesterase
LDRRRILLVHATPRDPLDEIIPPDPDMWAKRLEGVEADIVCVGHTHQQFAFEVSGTLVINPGSVGLPRDGDPRAAYAVLNGDQVEFRRRDGALGRGQPATGASQGDARERLPHRGAATGTEAGQRSSQGTGSRD